MFIAHSQFSYLQSEPKTAQRNVSVQMDCEGEVGERDQDREKR